MTSSLSFTRRELYEAWITKVAPHSKQQKVQAVLDYVYQKSDPKILEDKVSKNRLIHRVTSFCSELSIIIQKVKSLTKFESSREIWLNGNAFTISFTLVTPKVKGRPKTNFNKLSESNKRKRVQGLLNRFSFQELAYAAKMSARRAGHEDVAKLINEAVFPFPSRASHMRKAWRDFNEKKPVKPMTPEEGLSLMMDNDLSKHDYCDIRDRANEHNVRELYPSYFKVQKAKQSCLPHDQSIKITDTSVEVQLQALLDHTAIRLMKVQSIVTSRFTEHELHDLELVSKYGMDGMGDQAMYKQCFESSASSDTAIFLVNIVPLILRSKSNPQKILWFNVKSSSTRFCRPVRILFRKEDITLTNEVHKNMTEQIQNLTHTTGEIMGTSLNFRISHKVHCTMIDGKVCCALLDIAECRCINCGAYPVDMNDFEKMSRLKVDESTFEFGLSTLHAHIRFLECVLHVSYRLDVEKWRIYKSNKVVFDKVNAKQKQIQDEFRETLGLLVDQVKRGKGTTNDGNTARRFFENPPLTSTITGFDEELLTRFSVVLEVISCGFEVAVQPFRVYLLETYKLFLHKYSWFRVPQAVHRILMHGADIIENSPVPIGTLSEEPQESQNKFLKSAREHHTRKFSRSATNEHLVRYLLIRSDPLVSSMRRKAKSGRVRALSSTARSFLISITLSIVCFKLFLRV